MAEENATPAELAVLYVLVEHLGGHSVTMVNKEKGRRLGFSMGRSRTVAVPDVVSAAADTLRAENERLRAALFEELDHIRHDVRWAGGGRELERAMAREEAVEVALSEAQP